jgi:hypothetical protein
MPLDPHPEPGFRWARSAHTLGPSDARWSRWWGNVPSPGSMSIGSRKYKAQRAPQTLPIVGLAKAERTQHVRSTQQEALIKVGRPHPMLRPVAPEVRSAISQNRY